MPEPFIVGIALAGLGALLLGSKTAPKGAKLPDPDPKDMKTLTEWRDTPQGRARYFRKEFMPSVAIQLKTYGVQTVVDEVYKGSKILVYRLFPAAGGAPSPSAYDIAVIGYQSMAAVLVTANIWLHSGGDVYMAVIPYQQRSEWSNAGRSWAIEFDNQAGEDQPPKAAPPGRKTPGATTPATMLDANLTPEEAEAFAAMISGTQWAPEWLEAQAIQAETPGHGGTNHGTHPKAAAALRKRAAELRANLIHVKEPPAKKDEPTKKPPTDWGKTTPDVTDVDVDTDEPPPIDDVVPPPPQPFMHTIRTGDIPSIMAAYYTGDGSRYKDLAAIPGNGLGLGGPYGMTGWTVGKTIEIPASWNPQAKPVPPPAQGGGYVQDKTPATPGGEVVQVDPEDDDWFGDWGL